MKYYAVKYGREKGIYNSWDECKKQVDGFSGAVYKSFSTLEEAQTFLEGNIGNLSSADCIAYVDGSYDHSILAYGAGVVVLYNQKKYTCSKMNNHKDLVEMRNVAGEIEASMIAMRFAKEHHCRHLEICYDYEGIEKWCTGEWKTNKIGTKVYREYYLEMAQLFTITFKKIKSHSGNALNDEADQLAKKALGLL